MLPSWRKLGPQLRINVAHQCIVQVKWAGMQSHTWHSPDVRLEDAEQVPFALDVALGMVSPAVLNGIRMAGTVAVQLPDSLARLTTVPWSPDIRQGDELLQYARVQFELQGLALKEGWTLQCDWHARGASALAYALPDQLIERIQAHLATHGLVLDHLMPASAHCHYRPLLRQKHVHVHLLRQGHRISALAYHHARLLDWLQEADSEQPVALKRLLQRLTFVLPPDQITHVECVGCSERDLRQAGLSEAIMVRETSWERA
ncbi:hypothetical protein KSF73_16830 [Burkholderiaceae bacterium DAT-1]|nr:hypothetical protein [Burkholderiaceae bacterium DAT-1]